MKSLRMHGSRLFGFALLGFLLLLASAAQAATYTVSNTNDSGVGSLRQAITSANATAGLDTIVFSIPGAGVKTITPASALPTITQPLIIDGPSQPGFSGTPLIELNGTVAGATANGLKITAGSSWVKGLIINRFAEHGILIQGSSQTTVSGCYIGTNSSGNGDLGNGRHGVMIMNSTLNTVGGTTADRRNIISGNTSTGVRIEIDPGTPGGNNIVRGNRIGTNAAGTAALPNFIGVFLGSDNNLVGGDIAGAGNLISGNSVHGIATTTTADGQTIQGNFIGTTVTGSAKLGNGDFGIECTSANNLIGGSTPNAGNVVSGNLNSGLRLRQQGSGNQVKGNSFGSDKTEIQAVGNTNYGIIIQEQSNNQIGGTLDGEGNIIAFNKKGGIRVIPGDVVAGATGNALLRNRLFANEFGIFNTALGIDIGPEGVTPNDLKDPDTGANDLQNFPVLFSVSRDLSSTIFAGTLNGKANTEYRVELYRSETCDYSGHGEGQYYVGAITPLITNVNGNVNFNITMPLVILPIGQFVTATATDSSGNTSEFSKCVPVGAKIGGTFILDTDFHFVKENGGPATITVYRAGGNDGAVSIDYATSNGTATAPSDYSPKSGTLNFADGQTSKSFQVHITNDGIAEPDKFLNFTLSNPTPGVGVGFIGPGKVHIIDNDVNPDILEFSAGSYTVTESGGVLEVIIKRLDNGLSSEDSSVTFTASNGTATAADYSVVSGVVTFNSSVDIAKSVFITINNDMLNEANETINLTLTNPDAATLGPNSTAVVTITDNDPMPTVSIGDVTIAEGNNGTVNAAFPITLSAPSGQVVLVYFTTANGTATAGEDYVATSGYGGFSTGETSAVIAIPVKGDMLAEADQTFFVNITSVTHATVSDSQGQATITNDDAATPTVSVNDVSVTEGQSGQTKASFTVTLSAASNQTVTVDYATSGNTAQSGSDFQPLSQTLTFVPGQTTKDFEVMIQGDTDQEPDEVFFVTLGNPVNATLTDGQGLGTIINDDSPAGPTLEFSQATYSVAEQLGAVTVTVTRSGDTTAPATVDYATTDTTASQKSDFEIASGTLSFAAGEVSKTIKVLINQDMHIEGNENFNLVLSNPTGVTLGAKSTTNVTVTDDVPESPTNPIDDPQSFVHMQYHDFLNREPDAAGLQFWTNEIASCGNDAQCIEIKRVNVSAAFFLSIEFQQTGYLLYLIQKESFNSLPKYAAFMRDLQEVSQGVVVNSPGWQQKLALNQQQFADKWANRMQFKAIHDGMSNTAFVNTLFTNAGVIPTDAQRNALITALDSTTLTRGGALLEVANNSAFRQQEQNPAFVLMQYFGYLRRDPDSGPDTDLSGFFFWLNKLNSFNGDYQAAEMVKAFLVSDEYRQRFGQ